MTIIPLLTLSLAFVLLLPVDTHLRGAGAESVHQPAIVFPPFLLITSHHYL